jgi:transcriptional regulator with XRE-family HTH domain
MMAPETTDRPARRGRRPRGDGPHPVDIHVGSRIRMRRTLLGLSQEKLGDALGLTFQQVQKYERGANRVGSSRLFEISRILDVPVSFFFEDMPGDVAAAATAQQADPTGESTQRDPLAKRETLELVRAYYRIGDPRVRKRIFELMKAIAADGE